jgi:outer membrane lipoprotein-sorting protein
VIKKYSVVLFFLLVAASTLSANTSLDSFLSKVTTTPVDIEFKLDIFWAVREKIENKKGRLLLAPQEQFDFLLGKSRWVSDGVTVWQHNIRTNQVFIRDILDMDISSFPSALFEKFKERVFSVDSEDGNLVKYSWSRNGEKALYEKVAIVISKTTGVATQLILEDEDGNISTYHFKKFEFLENIDESDFSFELPKGAEVIEN